jgi:hypothetical protein
MCVHVNHAIHDSDTRIGSHYSTLNRQAAHAKHTVQMREIQHSTRPLLTLLLAHRQAHRHQIKSLLFSHGPRLLGNGMGDANQFYIDRILYAENGICHWGVTHRQEPS